MIELTPACQRTADVLACVKDDQLGLSTPCERMPLDALIAHIGGLCLAFEAAAGKEFGPLTDTPPADDAAIDADWRTAYPQRLAALALAWKNPAAWAGMTRAGGVELPAEVMGNVALAEVVIHGWDVARVIGEPYDVDAATLQACLAYLAQFDPAGTQGMFGPAVPIADDAPALDRVVALSGRDPAWRVP
ncbi:TIGR03086 family protein [Mycolicibacterium agri]|nr:TIGR03086 family metal-binding protein [Mycolicibacterium agri]PEG35066.1 TIGR03086 family protein [Mycolicibacterium agri]